MGNLLADQIERFIMKRFLEERDKEIILQRKEVADKLNCAPSQISYVLNTRFSNEQGFVVESKRGLGGFIRITIVGSNEDGEEDKKEIPSLADIDKSLYMYLREGEISQREAKLIHEVFAVLYSERNLQLRERLIKRMQERIGNVLKEG